MTPLVVVADGIRPALRCRKSDDRRRLLMTTVVVLL